MIGRCEAGKDVRENEKRSDRYAGRPRERYEHQPKAVSQSHNGLQRMKAGAGTFRTYVLVIRYLPFYVLLHRR